MSLIKAFTCLAILCCFYSYSEAQISGNGHELGIVMSSGLNLNLSYKYGTPKSLFRTSLLVLDGANAVQGDQFTDVYNTGIRLGYERRVPIIDHLSFVYGIDVGLTYRGELIRNEVNNMKLDRHALVPTVWLILGFNYVLKDHLVFGLEITPFFAYQIEFIEEEWAWFKEKREVHSRKYGLSRNSVNVSVAYRFQGKKKTGKK